MALLARKMCPEPIRKVVFTLYGSFSKTYHGHGTDRALLGGILGFDTDDARIRDAFDWAKKMGVEYEFVIDEETRTDHPNTADMDITGVNGHKLFVRGESIGGGKIRIVQEEAFGEIRVESLEAEGTVVVPYTEAGEEDSEDELE